MATISAIRWNPVIKSFYERLISKGKKKKVAITACMRKIIITLNVMMKNKTYWKPDFPRFHLTLKTVALRKGEY